MNKVLDVAKAEVGYLEGTNNDTKYGREYGMNHVPWCMIFVWWVFNKAGYGKTLLRTAGCEALETWAKKEKLTVPVSQIQAGDIVLFDFSKAGKSEHVGIAIGYNANTHLVDTYEGNTSGNSTGSQANGDGVYAKHRAPSTIRCVVRIK